MNFEFEGAGALIFLLALLAVGFGLGYMFGAMS